MRIKIRVTIQLRLRPGLGLAIGPGPGSGKDRGQNTASEKLLEAAGKLMLTNGCRSSAVLACS